MIARVCALMTGAGLAAAALAALPAMAQQVSPAIAAAVADPGRPAADTARDGERKPAETLAFAGVKEGQKVGELFPGGGYYTRVLSKIVGPKGHVYLMTPASFQARMQKSSDDLAAALPNTSVLFQPGDAPSPPEKVDVIWSTDNYHDYRNPGFGAVDMARFNKAVFDSLKPGGEYIIVDYVAAPGTGATQTGTNHRIEPATVKQEVEAAGFKLEGESKVLANPADDHSGKVFDVKPRGAADQ
ncbi:MAG: methyltransferase, partial [Caulobacteraceae bacterium]|nr:methyltransferase [Caulobacteraceae bacterium]